MRAFTITAPRKGEVRDVAKPDPGPGEAVVHAMYSLEPDMLADVRAYLALFAALIVLHVLHHYYNGLLIFAERTTWVLRPELPWPIAPRSRTAMFRMPWSRARK